MSISITWEVEWQILPKPEWIIISLHRSPCLLVDFLLIWSFFLYCCLLHFISCCKLYNDVVSHYSSSHDICWNDIFLPPIYIYLYMGRFWFNFYHQEWDDIIAIRTWKVCTRSKFCTWETWPIYERIWASGDFKHNLNTPPLVFFSSRINLFCYVLTCWLPCQREETNGVISRNVEFSQLIIDYQRKLREGSESVLAAEELSRKLTMEVNHIIMGYNCWQNSCWTHSSNFLLLLRSLSWSMKKRCCLIPKRELAMKFVTCLRGFIVCRSLCFLWNM